MMGVGKSSIGKDLSYKLKMEFKDIDSIIEKKLSLSISEIFKKKGEKFFRDIEEKETINYLNKNKVVIALGGGAFLNEKIRDEANVSIETQRSEKIIGSSLEANIEIKIKDKEMFGIAQKHDFSEICITSSASILRNNNLEKDIQVISSKAAGNKCPVCWKIRENVCERAGHCHLV